MRTSILTEQRPPWQPRIQGEIEGEEANLGFVYSYVSVKMVPVGSSKPGTAIGVELLTTAP